MEARDQHKTGNKCTTRRGCAGRGREAAHKHGAIVDSCARILQTEPYCKMDTFTVL